MFRNAYNGIKKLYIAEIIALVAGVITVVSVSIALANLRRGNAESALTALGAITIVAVIAAIVAAVISIIGLAQARKDERNFGIAFALTIAGLAVSVAAGFFPANSSVAYIAKACGTLLNLLVTVFSIYGIISLAGQLRNSGVAAQGAQLLRVIIATQVVAMIASIIAMIFGFSTAGLTGAYIASLVSNILSIVAYVLYISLLSKAKKMLERA